MPAKGLTDQPADERGQKSADVDPHVKDGETGVAAVIPFFVEFADDARNIRLKKTVAETNQGQRGVEKNFSGGRHQKMAQGHQNAAENNGLKVGKVAQPLRVVMTGGTVSPPIDVTVELIGRDRALTRIDQALKSLR